MTGKNTIGLNTATMKEAVEYYLKNVTMKDTEFTEFSVVSVIAKNGLSGEGFEVGLEGDRS